LRTRTFLVIAAIAAFGAFAPSASAADVTTDCDGLQDALDNAGHGDTITLDGVCDGNYTLPDFPDADDDLNAITLKGDRTDGDDGFDPEDGRALTGNNVHRFQIIDLDFSNGDTDGNGGAISVTGRSSLGVFNSNFDGNDADGSGGAIYYEQDDTPSDLAGFGFTSNTFSENSAGGDGGAVAVVSFHTNGNSGINDSTFSDNEALGSGGAFSVAQPEPPVARVSAAIRENGDNISFNGNTVEDNSAQINGGGGNVIMARNALLQLTNNTFSNNTIEQLESEPPSLSHFGGGLYVEGGETPIRNHDNVFEDNEIESIPGGEDYGGGGAAFVGNGTKVISSRDAFLRNTVTGQEFVGTLQPESLSAQEEDPEENESEGGGLFISGTNAAYNGFLNRVAGNAIGNGPNGYGGGAYAGALPTNEATFEFHDSTIAGNIVGIGGEFAGLAGNGNDNLILQNSIVWNPTQQFQEVLTAADTLNEPDIGEFDSIDVKYTDACQEPLDLQAADATQPFPGEGNQCVDPLLKDALQGDIHETSKSPTIDKGNDQLFFDAAGEDTGDFERDPRPTDGDGDGHTADQGADESPAFVVPPTTGQQTPPKPQCSDGIDNDGDGTIDANDPGCLSGPNDTYDPNDNDEANETIKDLVLCGRRDVSLIRADGKPGGKVRLSGLVATRFGGKKVRLYVNTGSGWKKIATKKTTKKGAFKLRVAGPSRDDFIKTRYQARIGKSRSATLKLPQSLTSLSVKKVGKNIVIKGKVKKSLLGPNPRKVTIRRLVCGHYLTMGKAMPDKNGRYTVKFKAPRLGTAALYRAETKVLARATSKKYVKAYARAIGIKTTSQTG
jgi:hypothetical protein